MNADLSIPAVSLRKSHVFRIRDGKGFRIECLSGSLWITQDGDVRDLIVEAGEGLTIERDAATLVSAMQDSRFVVLTETAPPTVGRRLMPVLARLAHR